MVFRTCVQLLFGHPVLDFTGCLLCQVWNAQTECEMLVTASAHLSSSPSAEHHRVPDTECDTLKLPKLPLPKGCFGQFRVFSLFRTENSAQRGSFGPDIPADIPPKTSVRPSKSWKNKHFGTDIPRGRP